MSQQEPTETHDMELSIWNLAIPDDWAQGEYESIDVSGAEVVGESGSERLAVTFELTR